MKIRQNTTYIVDIEENERYVTLRTNEAIQHILEIHFRQVGTINLRREQMKLSTFTTDIIGVEVDCANYDLKYKLELNDSIIITINIVYMDNTKSTYFLTKKA